MSEPSFTHSVAPLFREVPEGILWSDPEQKIVFANSPAATLIGDMGKDIEALYIKELFPELSCRMLQEYLATIDDGSEKLSGGMEVKVNGRQVIVNLIPIKRDKDKSFIFVLRDKTEDLKLSDLIRRRLRFLQALANIGLA